MGVPKLTQDLNLPQFVQEELATLKNNSTADILGLVKMEHYMIEQ